MRKQRSILVLLLLAALLLQLFALPAAATEADPVETEPVATDPVATDPVETDPMETDPVTTEPVPTQPAGPLEGSMEVFVLPEDQIQCPFADVPENAWYYSYVAYGASLGIINGKSPTAFHPMDNMTLAEAITLAVRAYERYYSITPDAAATQGSPWYLPYVTRAESYDLIPGGCENFTAPVRRDQAAAIFARILPEKELEPINWVSRLPDVETSNPYLPAILTLYRAGVLSGSDEKGSFRPASNATRAELVKILSGVINPGLRGRFQFKNGDMRAFTEQVSESPLCTFTDVPAEAWYYRYVAIQQELGILNGVSPTTYQPAGSVTYAQALKVAVEVYEKYYDLPPQPHTGRWWEYYVEKALEYGILVHPRQDYQVPAIRGDVALFLYRALEGKELAPINEVDAIPDVPETNFYHDTLLTFYRAGIMQGSDKYGTAHAYDNITRAELAALLTRLVLPDARLRFTLEKAQVIEKIQYGVSGSGKYALTAYRFGSGKNVMVLGFAIHGWEDNWARDGGDLVYLADQVRAYLETNYNLVADGDWTVYVLRCMNPDGLYLGNSHNGPGRCTTTYYDLSGNLLTTKGIDMNRCFPYNFQARTGSRNFNGTTPLQCKEARAIADFVRSVKGDGKNILVDVHGWLGQIITSAGKGTLYKAFYKQFPGNSYASLSGGSGYFSAWAAYSLGYDSCLLELPASITSHSRFLSSGCVGKFEAAITDLLQNYKTKGTPKGPMPEDEFELNGN